MIVLDRLCWRCVTTKVCVFCEMILALKRLLQSASPALHMNTDLASTYALKRVEERSRRIV